MLSEIKAVDCKLVIRPALEKAFATIGKELGIDFNIGSMTYTKNSIKFTTNSVLTNGDENVSVESVEWFKNCAKHGFNSDDLGKTFVSGKSGDMFKITGFKARNRKYPILAERVSDSKGFKFSPIMVRMALGRD